MSKICTIFTIMRGDYMSRGYGGDMDLVADDSTTLMYTYCCYNVNNDNYKKYMGLADGEIVIFRNALIEPEIHSKIKKLPGGHKRIVEKRVKRDVSWEDLFICRRVIVKNASGTWFTTLEGIDFIALKMLFKLFSEYQRTGEVPKHISWFC